MEGPREEAKNSGAKLCVPVGIGGLPLRQTHGFYPIVVLLAQRR